MNIEVKKIWHGDQLRKPKITLRSPWVNRAIKLNEPVNVRFLSNQMTLTVEQLKNPVGRRHFKSKIGKEDYYLLDYVWEPTI